MTAGYSGKRLIEKLGLKPGASALIVKAPNDYIKLLGRLPDDVTLRRRGAGPFDFIHLFAKSIDELHAALAPARRSLVKNGSLWVSWPKRTSGVRTDLDENLVRDMGLALGLVDVKVCAVDETWSGLKFVIRLANR
jgi:hypothetical protein